MKIRAIATLLFILFSISAFGQGRAKISGYIRDADGNPLDLVNIRVKNTLNGTMSNEKGHYSLSVATGDSVTLIYSCLGYNKAERILPQVTKDMRLNVQMNYTSLELGEVVATAIRKQTTTLETLNADRVKLLPDPAGGSIESLVVTFAGVTSNNELSSQYSVRGGSYDENIVYVNGLEVFRPLLIRSGQQEGLSFINPDIRAGHHLQKTERIRRFGFRQPAGSQCLCGQFFRQVHTGDRFPLQNRTISFENNRYGCRI